MTHADRHVARFVLETRWETLPSEVRLRAVMCAVDLLGALLAGTVTPVAAVGRKTAARYFPGTSASIFPGGATASIPGVALANGLAANALDIDDGHPIVKGHPGAVVFPALMAAAESRNARLQDFLATLVAAYEVALRAGFVMQEHYAYYHSSGAWGAVGAAAGVARLMGLDQAGVVEAMATADFHAPFVPVMRSVRRPVMSKDGVGWGSMAGALAALMAADGFTGGESSFGYPEAHRRVMDLGGTYEIMNVYFKPHACCRWAHPAIDAVIDLRRTYDLKPANVESIRIKTFQAAAELYHEKPLNTEEAQYNAAYPVAVAMAAGEVGPRQIIGDRFPDREALLLMDSVEICTDDRFEREFPARRLCEVEIVLKGGKTLPSGVYSLDPDRNPPVSIKWIAKKFHSLTEGLLSGDRADDLIAFLSSPENNPPVRKLVALATVR